MSWCMHGGWRWELLLSSYHLGFGEIELRSSGLAASAAVFFNCYAVSLAKLYHLKQSYFDLSLQQNIFLW